MIYACPSCSHTDNWHDETGCDVCVLWGRPGAVLNCPCGLPVDQITKWQYDLETDSLVAVDLHQ